jgi:hypothetical protein
MEQFSVNPEQIIEDLLDQVRQLTLQTAVLRSAVKAYQASVKDAEDGQQ